MVWSSRKWKSALSSKYRTFKVNGNFPTRERPRKTWNEVIISDLKKRKVSKDLANYRNWKLFRRDHQTHANLEKKVLNWLLS